MSAVQAEAMDSLCGLRSRDPVRAVNTRHRLFDRYGR